MLANCSICNKSINIKSFKGINLTPLFCSADCFVKVCSKIAKPISDNVAVRINKDIRIFRSSLEEKFMKIMLELNIPVEYEPVIFIAKHNEHISYYKPDFIIKPFDVFIEIKGAIWGSGAYSKFKTYSKYIPLLLINNYMFKFLKK